MPVTRDAFQRTIDANPGESGPGLVLADWLEEQGETDEAEAMRVAYCIQENSIPLPVAAARSPFAAGAIVTGFGPVLIGRFKSQRNRDLFHSRSRYSSTPPWNSDL